MTLYDMLRRLVFLAAMPEWESKEANELVDELERLNALGTMARRTENSHQHEWIQDRFKGVICNVCGKGR